MSVAQIHVRALIYLAMLKCVESGTYEGKEHTTYIVHSGNIEKLSRFGISPLALMYSRYIFIDYTPSLQPLILVMRAAKLTTI